MISGGNVTVFVANMDAAIRFYTEVLGLKLKDHYGDHWATIDAGRGLTIGLHPPSQKHPAPGTKGGMMIGLEVDRPIEEALAEVVARGLVGAGEILRGDGGNFVDFEDIDGNPLYLWETAKMG